MARTRDHDQGSANDQSETEEAYSDDYAGKQVMPWRIEDAARARGANYIQGGLFKPFVVRDGRLITGQQQYSGRKVAQLVINTLGTSTALWLRPA